MSDNIRAISFGLGKMGSLIAKYMHEKGVEIVCAVDKFAHVGKDVGLVSGIGKNLGVLVCTNAGTALSEDCGDVAILATCSSLFDLLPDAKLCMENGLNVITITESAFYPWTHSPDIAGELDAIAKENGVSILPTGVPDIYYTNLMALLAAGCHHIEGLSIEATANFGKLGPALLNNLPLGISPPEFSKLTKVSDEDPPPSVACMILECLAHKLKLGIKSVRFRTELVTDEVDIVCESNGKVIKAGQISGLKEIVIIDTDEGIVMDVSFTAKVFGQNDHEYTDIKIKGIPNIHTRQDNLPGYELTCTTVVNRIPDVINGKPGLITADSLPFPQFCVHPLHTYLVVNG